MQVPIIFEGPIPRPEAQWPMVTKDDRRLKLMLQRVQKGFGQLNTIPAPPGTALLQPDALEHAVDHVIKLLSQGGSANQRQGQHDMAYVEQPEPEPEATAAIAPVRTAVAYVTFDPTNHFEGLMRGVELSHGHTIAMACGGGGSAAVAVPMWREGGGAMQITVRSLQQPWARCCHSAELLQI